MNPLCMFEIYGNMVSLEERTINIVVVTYLEKDDYL